MSILDIIYQTGQQVTQPVVDPIVGFLQSQEATRTAPQPVQTVQQQGGEQVIAETPEPGIQRGEVYIPPPQQQPKGDNRPRNFSEAFIAGIYDSGSSTREGVGNALRQFTDWSDVGRLSGSIVAPAAGVAAGVFAGNTGGVKQTIDDVYAAPSRLLQWGSPDTSRKLSEHADNVRSILPGGENVDLWRSEDTNIRNVGNFLLGGDLSYTNRKAWNFQRGGLWGIDTVLPGGSYDLNDTRVVDFKQSLARKASIMGKPLNEDTAYDYYKFRRSAGASGVSGLATGTDFLMGYEMKTLDFLTTNVTMGLVGEVGIGKAFMGGMGLSSAKNEYGEFTERLGKDAPSTQKWRKILGFESTEAYEKYKKDVASREPTETDMFGDWARENALLGFKMWAGGEGLDKPLASTTSMFVLLGGIKAGTGAMGKSGLSATFPLYRSATKFLASKTGTAAVFTGFGALNVAQATEWGAKPNRALRGAVEYGGTMAELGFAYGTVRAVPGIRTFQQTRTRNAWNKANPSDALMDKTLLKTEHPVKVKGYKEYTGDDIPYTEVKAFGTEHPKGVKVARSGLEGKPTEVFGSTATMTHTEPKVYLDAMDMDLRAKGVTKQKSPGDLDIGVARVFEYPSETAAKRVIEYNKAGEGKYVQGKKPAVYGDAGDRNIVYREDPIFNAKTNLPVIDKKTGKQKTTLTKIEDLHLTNEYDPGGNMLIRDPALGEGSRTKSGVNVRSMNSQMNSLADSVSGTFVEGKGIKGWIKDLVKPKYQPGPNSERWKDVGKLVEAKQTEALYMERQIPNFQKTKDITILRERVRDLRGQAELLKTSARTKPYWERWVNERGGILSTPSKRQRPTQSFSLAATGTIVGINSRASINTKSPSIAGQSFALPQTGETIRVSSRSAVDSKINSLLSKLSEGSKSKSDSKSRSESRSDSRSDSKSKSSSISDPSKISDPPSDSGSRSRSKTSQSSAFGSPFSGMDGGGGAGAAGAGRGLTSWSHKNLVAAQLPSWYFSESLDRRKGSKKGIAKLLAPGSKTEFGARKTKAKKSGKKKTQSRTSKFMGLGGNSPF